jgi:hypothetical protein
MARRWSRLLQARVGIASVSAAERLLLLCLGNPVIPRATIARGRGGSHPSMAIPMDRNASHDATRMHELISARRDEHSLEWRACSGSGKKSAVCRHNAAALTVGLTEHFQYPMASTGGEVRYERNVEDQVWDAQRAR